MSLPVVLPGSCCRLSGAALAHQFANASYRSRSRCVSALPARMSGSQTRMIPALLPARPLLSLGLLQLVLGCSMVALSFGALSLSNSPPIRNSCPFWAGSSVSIRLLSIIRGANVFILHHNYVDYRYWNVCLTYCLPDNMSLCLSSTFNWFISNEPELLLQSNVFPM